MVECHVVQNGDEAIIKRQRERPQRELDVDFYDATAHLCLDEHLLWSACITKMNNSKINEQVFHMSFC
jgi:hypothetical protein